jgi:hypothetical protein
VWLPETPRRDAQDEPDNIHYTLRFRLIVALLSRGKADNTGETGRRDTSVPSQRQHKHQGPLARLRVRR